MPHAVFTSGGLALITGGASGIGLAVAKLAHQHGMRVAIVDINAEALSAAKKILTRDGNEAAVQAYTVDVSRIEQWADLKVKVEEKFGSEVNFLMLNAGIGLKGGWEDGGYFRKIMDTNLFGVINGLTTFLGAVSAAATSSPTAIVITGSKQGITNPPGNMAYNASKAAVKTLAEHLSYDMRSTSTSVHLLVPGWTFTGLTQAKEKPDGAWAPEQVADFLFQKMEEGQFYIICPDNDVTEDLDRRRMLWTAGDLVYGRPPLSRWREEWKEKAKEGIESTRY